MAMLSGGRDSVCMLDLAVRARGRRARSAPCTSTTACATTPTKTSATAPSSASRSGWSWSVERPRRPEGPGNLQAWARDCSLRRRGAAGAAADGDDRHRPHRRRPGRDDPLPARLLAEPPGPAGDAPARRQPRPAAARHDRAEITAYCEQRGLAWRDDAPTPSRPTPATGSAAACCRSWQRSTRRRRRTCCARPSCCATRPRCSTRWSPPRSTAPAAPTRGTIALASACGSCTRRCAGSSSSSSPTAPPGGRFRAPPATPTRSPALRRTGGAMLDLGGGVRAVVERGVLRAERRAAV